MGLNDLEDQRKFIHERFEDATEAEEDGKFERVLSLCEEIIGLDERHADAWKMRTRALIALERLDQALSSAEEGLRRFPNTTAHRLMKARIQVRLRQWQEAEATYRAILADKPLTLNAIRELMDFETIRLDDDIAQTLVRHQNDLSLKPYDRASTWFLLAQIHLNAGRDDEAFALYAEGNRQMRELHEGSRLEYGFSRLLPEFDAAFQGRHARLDPPPPCPLLLIVGLPRSGKSLLERLLASQPDLVAGGEVSFIYSLFLDVDRTHGADEAMRRLMRPQPSPIARRFRMILQQNPKKSATRVIDTTPGNLEQLAFLGPMHPDVPVVFVRRDPSDLATALFFKQFNKAHRYTYDLEIAARAIARTEHLAQLWQRTLPNPMIEVSYEEIVRDPVGTARRVLERFGLAVDEAALHRAATDDGRKLNLMPGRSLDGVGAIRGDLVGFSDRFSRHLTAVLPAYEAERRVLGDRS
jgi:tetratricopeptide (TPR) repeat protein